MGSRLECTLNVYLDTHIILWMLEDARRLSVRAIDEIEAAASLLISPIIRLELEFLFERGKTEYPAEAMMNMLRERLEFNVCDLSYSTIVSVAAGEHWTRDPFDRLIVANAKAAALAPLITADENILHNYPCAVW